LLAGTETGDFEWEVLGLGTITGLTKAEMTITRLAGSVLIDTIDLEATSSAVTPLAPGIYSVRFELEKSDGATPPTIDRVIWHELLYIYSWLTSEFDITFDDTWFHRTNYIVTFNYNDEFHDNSDTPLITGLMSRLHGQTIGLGGTPTSTGYHFEGWYTTSTFDVGTRWDLENDPVIDDLELFARWTANRITITLLEIDNIPDELNLTFTPDPGVTPIVLSRIAEDTIDIVVSGLTWHSIEWVIEGVGVGTTVSGNTGTISLDATDLRYNSVGQHVVRLTIFVSHLDPELGTTRYLINIPFNIVD
jgi:uncharacterized repeat protein (TIGR02543 family)